jgi:hypothetical protein
MIPGSLILRNLHPIFWAYLALCLHRFAVEGIPWSINLNGFIFQQLINCYNVFFPTLIPNIFTVLYVCSLVFHLYIAVCYFFCLGWNQLILRGSQAGRHGHESNCQLGDSNWEVAAKFGIKMTWWITCGKGSKTHMSQGCTHFQSENGWLITTIYTI